MATRSGIGALNPDGTVESVYCHWDGGPEGAGRVLATHYTAPAKVRALLAHGNISSIGPEIRDRRVLHPNETQQQTADAVGCSRQMVTKIERELATKSSQSEQKVAGRNSSTSTRPAAGGG